MNRHFASSLASFVVIGSLVGCAADVDEEDAATEAEAVTGSIAADTCMKSTDTSLNVRSSPGVEPDESNLVRRDALPKTSKRAFVSATGQSRIVGTRTWYQVWYYPKDASAPEPGWVSGSFLSKVLDPARPACARLKSHAAREKTRLTHEREPRSGMCLRAIDGEVITAAGGLVVRREPTTTAAQGASVGPLGYALATVDPQRNKIEVREGTRVWFHVKVNDMFTGDPAEGWVSGEVGSVGNLLKAPASDCTKRGLRMPK
jgi:hypothetical protein